MKKIVIPIIIGILVIGILLGFSINDEIKKAEIAERGKTIWNTSGPFSLQEYQHRLGEHIFMTVEGLQPNEKGWIRVFMPNGHQYTQISFDGSQKSSFNTYFKPDTQAKEGRCAAEDLVGVWTVVFDGTTHRPIEFEFINEYIIGGEVDINNLCPGVERYIEYGPSGKPPTETINASQSP